MPTEDLRAIELLRRVPYGRVATSMRALPFLAVARHIVVQGRVLLRMHAGFNHHQACHGSVVAYGADNFHVPVPGDETLWAVQCTGTAEIFEPATAELELFGRGPHYVGGELFDPVYLRIEPQFVTAHTLNSAPERRREHAL
ncbi:pyridoxamine 5'-phosphate oxidase family protein [Streptomyces flavidovirens]|uniref:pyridoxamine 5'-phosphate oxidase family protein n=1 Tax=Streptomyces flavidovirens TaxID=67298 RepID=UPI000403CDA7|nr:pyridoxamine 5'-phosphate oxidase family protein [Streptomyces flavidovirens]